MSEENEEIFGQWIERVWNQGDERIIDELLDENVVADYPYNIEENPVYGRDGYKRFVRFVRGLFSGIRINIEQIASDENNKVIAFCTFAANRRAVGATSLPTYTSVKTSGLCQMIFENGKIIQVWCNIDLFGTIEPEQNYRTGNC